MKVGEEVKVHFNLKGTKWVKDGRENYITNLDAWRIESFVPSMAAPVAAPSAPPKSSGFDPNAMQHSSSIEPDDLPF